MTLALGVVLLALLWAAVNDAFNLPTILMGAAIAMAALWLVRDNLQQSRLLVKLRRALSLLLLFLRELMMSAIKVALLVIRPDMHAQLSPGLIKFPLRAQSDAEIAVLANLITLTPGTLSVDVSDDRKTLYIHALTIGDREALIADIAQGFERKVMEVFK